MMGAQSAAAIAASILVFNIDINHDVWWSIPVHAELFVTWGAMAGLCLSQF